MSPSPHVRHRPGWVCWPKCRVHGKLPWSPHQILPGLAPLIGPYPDDRWDPPWVPPLSLAHLEQARFHTPFLSLAKSMYNPVTVHCLEIKGLLGSLLCPCQPLARLATTILLPAQGFILRLREVRENFGAHIPYLISLVLKLPPSWKIIEVPGKHHGVLAVQESFCVLVIFQSLLYELLVLRWSLSYVWIMNKFKKCS